MERAVLTLIAVRGKTEHVECRHHLWHDAYLVTYTASRSLTVSPAQGCVTVALALPGTSPFRSPCCEPLSFTIQGIQANLQSAFQTAQRSISTLHHCCRLPYLCKFFSFHFWIHSLRVLRCPSKTVTISTLSDLKRHLLLLRIFIAPLRTPSTYARRHSHQPTTPLLT